MSERGPDFDELVGTDLEASERERLLHVHELLVAAGPPPELQLREDVASTREPVRFSSRRRRGAPLALAAALGAVTSRWESWSATGATGPARSTS